MQLCDAIGVCARGLPERHDQRSSAGALSCSHCEQAIPTTCRVIHTITFPAS